MYWSARTEEQYRVDIYQQYIANTMYYTNEGKRLGNKLMDILEPQPEMPEITQEEIIENLKKGGIQIL